MRISLLPLILTTVIASSAVPLVLTYLNPQRSPGIVFLAAQPEQNAVYKHQAYISGAVLSPGRYEVKSNMRIGDLITAAGGLAKNVDTAFMAKELNLAQSLKDEQHIFIPFAAQIQSIPSQPLTSSKINLNTASISLLMELPGVGQSTAESIVSARPFASIEQLNEVSGIGESKWLQLKDLVAI